jgi:hypothetical protein
VSCGSLLLAHGLVHLPYLVPAAADPKYPSSLASSRLFPRFTRSPVALVLITAVAIGFLASALALGDACAGASGSPPSTAPGVCQQPPNLRRSTPPRTTARFTFSPLLVQRLAGPSNEPPA